MSSRASSSTQESNPTVYPPATKVKKSVKSYQNQLNAEGRDKAAGGLFSCAGQKVKMGGPKTKVTAGQPFCESMYEKSVSDMEKEAKKDKKKK